MLAVCIENCFMRCFDSVSFSYIMSQMFCQKWSINPNLIIYIDIWKKPNTKYLCFLYPGHFGLSKILVWFTLDWLDFLCSFVSFHSIINYFEHQPNDIVCTDPGFETSRHLQAKFSQTLLWDGNNRITLLTLYS